MGKIKFKCVLTGGPCAGKTTTLTSIREDLESLGYHVFVISESATDVISSGIKPFGNMKVDYLDFQRIILKYQLTKEKLLEEFIQKYVNDDKCFILYDRGIIDNKAYINNEDFNKILTEMNLNELSLMDNYDMVIHLVTAADGKEEFYTLENNQSRTETKEEARRLDKNTMNAWSFHRNLVIIDNSTNFNEKINRTINKIHNLIGIPDKSLVQRKFLIDHVDNALLEQSIKISTTQYYIDGHYETRLRHRNYNGDDTYFFTIQKKNIDGTRDIIQDKKIKKSQFEKLLKTSKILNIVNKDRYTFIYNKTFYALDIFDDNQMLLEVNSDEDVLIPSSINVIKEVTNDSDYQNINIKRKCLNNY